LNTRKYLESSDGHSVYYESNGNENGIPVVFLHGGPGSGCSESSKSFFDKQKWFSVFFDQRGCGLSKPSGETKNNNTENLVKDIEMLREVLGIKKWVVFGGSWGSTLALKYACEYPQNVSALILRGIFLASSNEIDWFLLELRRFIPKNWKSFVQNINIENYNSSAIIDYYYNAIFSNNREKAITAANSWRAWEEAAMRLTYNIEQPGEKKSNINDSLQNDDKILSSMKIHLHYLQNNCFLKENELMNKVQVLKTIPTYMIQGQLDTICPPETAETLHEKMTWSVINRVRGAGHGAYEQPIKKALIEALKVVEGKLKNGT
tara:strand:+ start:22 stop:981 length:960 start_codon:yes stop_codon:yes gene_type:complete